MGLLENINPIFSSDINFIGIDGCSKGWICAIIKDNKLSVKSYNFV